MKFCCKGIIRHLIKSIFRVTFYKKEKGDTDMNLDFKSVLDEDEKMKDGQREYEKMITTAQELSEEITSGLLQEVVKDKRITLQVAVMACARAMVNCAMYYYDDEDSFMADLKLARKEVVDKVVPAMLDPKPCGVCEACRKGKPCINPELNTSCLTTKCVPLVAESLVDYDTWNKVLYMSVYGPEPKEEDVWKDTPSEPQAAGGASEPASGDTAFKREEPRDVAFKRWDSSADGKYINTTEEGGTENAE